MSRPPTCASSDKTYHCNCCLGIYFYFFLLLFLNIGVLFVFQTPVIALVGNDACWSQIAREQVPMFGSSIGCDLEVRHILLHQGKAGINIKPLH